MPYIEGVGDEVVQFVAVILVILVAVLAWLSTNARPDRYRTVLVMRSRAHHPVTVSIRTNRPNSRVTNIGADSIMHSLATDSIETNTTQSVDEIARENTRVIPVQEMDSIVDADMAMINHNRLHFYRRIDTPMNGSESAAESTSDESEAQEEPEPASNAQIREMDSIVSAMEADINADPFSRPNENLLDKNGMEKNITSAVNNTEAQGDTANAENIESTSESQNQSIVDTKKIVIRLKYLNDTLKEVDGSLDELLKDFKWRHFSPELSSERRVRLIFRGRVLADEAATLRALGLHHGALLHCLVHPARSAAATAAAAAAGAAQTTTSEPAAAGERPAEAPERTWDLENILMTLVSVALTVVWFFRCEYSNMFTASASVALFGLTVFYSVAIFGLYLSDTFHFDRRPPQPVPNN